MSKTKWWDRELLTKTQAGLLFLGVISLAIAAESIQNYIRDIKLSDCSVYTIAVNKRVKYLKLNPWFDYDFSYKNQVLTRDARIPSSETNEWERVNKAEWENRRFWVQVHCEDAKTHKILWDYKVPDTLRFIPQNGWNELPKYAIKK